MATHGHSSSGSGTNETAPTSRDYSRDRTSSENDRPFAEIRRNLNQILRVLLLHRWAFFVPCCLVATVVFVMSLSYPRTYTASTSFERRDDPILLNLELTEGTGSWKYWRGTMATDLTSLKIMTEAVETMGLTEGLPRGENGELTATALKRRESLARSMAGYLEIFTQAPTDHMDVVRIVYTGPDPKKGRNLVESVKKAYIRQAMQWIREFLREQHDYFTKARDEVFKTMNAARRDLTELRLANPHIDPDHPSGIRYDIAQLESELRNLKLRRREHEAELSAERELVAGSEAALSDRVAAIQQGTSRPNQGDTLQPAEPVSAAAQHIEQQIEKLGSQIASLKATRGMTDQHPDIVELAAKRDWFKEQLEKQRAQDRKALATNTPMIAVIDDPPIESIADDLQAQQARAERARAKVRIGLLQSKINEIELDIHRAETKLGELSVAEKNLHGFQERYTSIKERINSAEEVYGQHAETIAKLQPSMAAIEQGKLFNFLDENKARGAATPVNPRSTTVFMLALLAGVGAGALFVLLAELFDHNFRGQNQVSRVLGLPILESIDEIVTSIDRRRRFLWRVVYAPVILAVGLGTTGISGSLAYLSLNRPWAYERIIALPERALESFARIEGQETPPPDPTES